MSDIGPQSQPHCTQGLFHHTQISRVLGALANVLHAALVVILFLDFLAHCLHLWQRLSCHRVFTGVAEMFCPGFEAHSMKEELTLFAPY